MPPKNRAATGAFDAAKSLAPKGAEKNLLAAIERLRNGSPMNPDLKERAKAGKLKINATTATMEAGCARRLAYAFDRVRKALDIGAEEAPAAAGEKRTAPEQVPPGSGHATSGG